MSTQRQTETRQKAEEAAKAALAAAAASGTPPEQTQQTSPNPELQAKLTDPAVDRQEQHVVDENPDDADRRSAEAPGIRTEAEVIADHQADNERAAAALAANPHTADPAASTSAVKDPRVRVDDRLVFFKNIVTGHIDAVNEGTPEHAVILRDADFQTATRAEARAYAKKADA